MLAPFRGRPILAYVVDAVRRAVPDAPVVVLTSEETSDDPLALYAASLGADVFRGPLDDVLGRFRRALDRADARAEKGAEAEWVLRICGDSPLLSATVLRRVIDAAAAAPEADLVTTTHDRTFPRGQNAELVPAGVLRRLDDSKELTAENREHVTHAIHKAPSRYTIVNVTSGRANLSDRHHAIDTIEDLLRLETADLDAELEGVGK